MLRELTDFALFILYLNAWALFITYVLIGFGALVTSAGVIWGSIRLFTRKKRARHEASDF